MQLKLVLISLLVGAAAGVYVTKRYMPEVQTVEKEVAKEKIVERIVERTNPDGSKEKTTERTETRREEKAKSEAPQALAQWRAGAALGIDKDMQRQYQVTVERRLIGPVWAGAYGHSRGEAGVILSIEF